MSGLSERDLEGLVGEALAARREVPASWREAAQAAFIWREVDRELLELTYDSQREVVAAVRGDAGHILEFSGGGLVLEVELIGLRVIGQLSATDAAQVAGDVVLERANGSSTTGATDETGFFVLECHSAGPVRFAVSAGATRLVTEWVVV